MLAIGEFSRLTHLSVRTLRRYHDADLLVPATVDESTGYRYYGADQIPTAQVDWTTHPFLAQKDHPRAS
jgi:DNA-binding transcriptional MerR regulator